MWALLLKLLVSTTHRLWDVQDFYNIMTKKDIPIELSLELGMCPELIHLGTEKVSRDSVEPGLFREVEVWRDGVFSVWRFVLFPSTKGNMTFLGQEVKTCRFFCCAQLR